MKRLEPNLLLAFSTGVALILLVLTASVYGEAGGALKYPLMTGICVIAFVMLNLIMQRRMKRPTPLLINQETPSTAVFASFLPLIIIALAAIPIFWSGHDYGLLVIIGSVLAGAAVESAIKARRLG